MKAFEALPFTHRWEEAMTKIAKATMAVVLVGGAIVIAAWAGGWFLRWTTAVHVFALVRHHVRDSLGLSEALAAVVAWGAATGAALLVTVLVKTRHFIVASVLAVACGIPLALWNDAISADKCFDRKTDKALCALWMTPKGQRKILRKDGEQPPSSWILVHADATHGDVRAYLADRGDSPIVNPADRVPRQIAVDSCTPPPVFFDASGEPVVFWSRSGDAIELWDRSGFHPTTGAALNPMTSEIAAEVCKKLADEKMKRDAQLAAEAAEQARQQAAQEAAELAQRQEQEKQEAQRRLDEERAEDQRAAAEAAEQARQQAAQEAAELAQRQEQEKQEAQRRLDEERAEESRRAAAEAARANWARQSAAPVSVPPASLTLRNNDCWAVDVYVDRQMNATVGAQMSLPLSIYPGNHLLRVCRAGTSGCSPEFLVNTANGVIAFGVNAQPRCGFPPAGYFVPAPNSYRMVERRNMWLPFRMGRR
jgi:hypothetical protein